MPRPWPAVSADHARTTSDAWFGGVRKRPRAGRLQVLRSVRSWKRTRYAMRWPAGRSVNSTRAVKPVSSRAAGPTTRRASANESVVAYSTTIRAGRSVRLQTVARPAVTSPAEVPLGMPGRAPSEGTTPGARPAHARVPPSPMRPPSACRRKRRLLLQVTGGGNPGKARGLGRGAHDRVGHDFSGEGADEAGVGLAGERARGEGEDRVAVARRVHRGDGARVAVVGHLRHLPRLDLGQDGVGGDDADGRALAG